jgi:1,4-dihydroxy-2-naphthoyl-CoA hydrolase
MVEESAVGSPTTMSVDSAFARAVGLELDEVGPTRVVGHIELGPEHHQPMGLVHGGVYCAAIEAAASIGAGLSARERGLGVVGVNNNTHFVAGISEGRVTVVAEPIVQGRTQQLWTVDIRRASDDRLVATGQLRVQNVEPR